MIHTDDAASRDHGCGVCDTALNRVVVDHPFFESVDKPHHGCAATGCLRQTTQHLEVLLDETFAKNKILRRITDDGELGYHKHIGVDCLGPHHRLEDPFLIAGEVPDGEIDLCSGNPDRRHRPETVSSMRKSTTATNASWSSAPEAIAPW